MKNPTTRCHKLCRVTFTFCYSGVWKGFLETCLHHPINLCERIKALLLAISDRTWWHVSTWRKPKCELWGGKKSLQPNSIYLLQLCGSCIVCPDLLGHFNKAELLLRVLLTPHVFSALSRWVSSVETAFVIKTGVSLNWVTNMQKFHSKSESF